MNKLMHEEFNEEVKAFIRANGEAYQRFYKDLDDPVTYVVSFKEFEANLDNPHWMGWFFLREMSKTWYNYKSFRHQTWYEHCKNFLNGYLLEKALKARLDLTYLGDDHEYLSGGYGKGLADFMDEEGHTVEVKNVCSYWSYMDRVKANDMNWHRAEIRYLYVRDERNLYLVDNFTNQIIQPRVATFTVPRVWVDYTMFE